jgi:NTP pyrophosphatase (non-canonical NTP hydrolase)
MSNFKDEIYLELMKGLGTLSSLRDRDQLSLNPEMEWASVMADKITAKFEGAYVPFVSEVEEFNTTMGKDWQNRTEPHIDKADADFVINFIQEELDELKEAVEKKNIVEILDALLDITYVGLGNGAMVFGLKDKMWAGYQEVQASNLSKICNTLEEAKETVRVRSEEQGTPCHYEEVNGKYVVYRSHDNKVMKSINYFRPDLSQFFSENDIMNTFVKG